MRGMNRTKLVSLSIVLVFTLSIVAVKPQKVEAITPFFTLDVIANGAHVADIFNLVKQQLIRIGIDLDIRVVDWPTFIGELLHYWNYDIVYIGLAGGGVDPDFTGVYNENGSLNFFGYHTSMDWDDELGTGFNEWYMKEGTLMMPPDSDERIQHYWAWEQYLMDELCPILPTFSQHRYNAYWANLQGYNYTEGLMQSWGKMSWDGAHTGQLSTDELIITDAAWSNLNPLLQTDTSSSFISSAALDPLIWYDSDLSVWPHLAKSYTYINDTTIEIVVRDGIKWQDDPEGNFTDEYLNIKDVFFTLYSLKNAVNNLYIWDWIKDMEIVDDMTMKIYIDSDDSTPENDPYSPSLPALSTRILPEHYLNQSQLGDGITPNITHISWTNFSEHCFGTGLFYLDNLTVGSEAILKVRPDSWMLDETITLDIKLNWLERFGFGTNWDANGLDQLRIRIIPDQHTALAQFEAGKVDLEDVTNFPEKMVNYITDTTKDIQTELQFSFSFFGYNMRENRVPIGSREPCEDEPSITKGLAIRKAINYAIDLDEINNIIYDSSRVKCYWPIYSAMGIWCNPNIIRYDYDLYQAKYYMYLAGYEIDGFTPSQTQNIGNEIFTISVLALLTAMFGINLVIKTKKKKR